jgi:NAD(P) transhydrogenase subunit alpha
MKIAVPRETRAGERRVALVPESCKKLVAAGIEVAVEAGAGSAAYFADAAFEEVGATVLADGAALLGAADLVLMVQPPTTQQVGQLRDGAMLLTTLMPLRNLEVVQALATRGVTAFSTDCIPRTTRAQSMDTLSSMANIAGYKAAIIGAEQCAKYFPMFMTAAGTVFAAKVLVIGAGVAGLQAIATARRLGANVSATDTRAVVKEQIESLGAKFVTADLGEDAQTASGYAKELSAVAQQKQVEFLAQQVAAADVVITTALIGGYKAPKLITADMVAGMRPGSVIVDLAAEGGGNCALTQPGETVEVHGVKICAPLNLPSSMPVHGSTLYSRNLTTFVLEFWKDKAFQLDLADEIIAGALVTHAGAVRHAGVRQALGLGGDTA